MDRIALASKLIVLLTATLFVMLTLVQAVSFGAPWGETAALDSRLAGYDAEAAARFLEVIGSDGRLVFFGIFRTLDTVFPPLLALTLIILFRRVRRRHAGLGIAVFALIPAAYLAADLVENAFLMDLRDTEMFDQVVRYAASATILKYVALAAAALGIAAAALQTKKEGG